MAALEQRQDESEQQKITTNKGESTWESLTVTNMPHVPLLHQHTLQLDTVSHYHSPTELCMSPNTQTLPTRCLLVHLELSCPKQTYTFNPNKITAMVLNTKMYSQPSPNKQTLKYAHPRILKKNPVSLPIEITQTFQQ